MKVKCDDQEIFELTPTQIKCIENDIPKSECKADLQRRLKYILTHKYEQCFKRLKTEWEPKLKAKGLKSIPLDDQEFCELVFAQEEYEDREAREAKNKDK